MRRVYDGWRKVPHPTKYKDTPQDIRNWIEEVLMWNKTIEGLGGNINAADTDIEFLTRIAWGVVSNPRPTGRKR